MHGGCTGYSTVWCERSRYITLLSTLCSVECSYNSSGFCILLYAEAMSVRHTIAIALAVGCTMLLNGIIVRSVVHWRAFDDAVSSD